MEASFTDAGRVLSLPGGFLLPGGLPPLQVLGLRDLITPSQLLRIPTVTLPGQGTLNHIFYKSMSLVATF